MITSLRKNLNHPFALLLLGIFLFALTLFYHLARMQKFENLQADFVTLLEKKKLVEVRRGEEEKVLKQLKEAEADFVETHLEKLSFLKEEVKRTQALLHSDPQNTELNKLLQSMKSTSNHLHFQQQKGSINGKIQETLLKQGEPVLLSEGELKELLLLLENPSLTSSHPPLFLIKSFTLSKESLSSDQECFKLRMELLKREMIL